MAAKQSAAPFRDAPYLPQRTFHKNQPSVAQAIQPLVGTEIQRTAVFAGGVARTVIHLGIVQPFYGQHQLHTVDTFVQAHPQITLPVKEQTQYRVVLQSVLAGQILRRLPFQVSQHNAVPDRPECHIPLINRHGI